MQMTALQTLLEYHLQGYREIDITRPLPRMVKVLDPSGREFEQEIVYDWELEYYNSCLQIGHSYKPIREPIREQRQARQTFQGRQHNTKQVWRKNENAGG